MDYLTNGFIVLSIFLLWLFLWAAHSAYYIYCHHKDTGYW